MTSVRVSSKVISLDVPAVHVVSPRSRLSELLSRAAVSIAPEATLADAVDTMRNAAVSALLVDDLGGIITERDIARALGGGTPADETVRAVATPDPIVVSGDVAIVDACAVMLNEQVRHLVVALPDGSLGVCSLRDVAAVLLQGADRQLWLASMRVALDVPPPEVWLG